ncbi:MAG: hypothetical protein LUH18_07385 [Oscillospiraceae bacterium]|nr:hypothetical protein [Oscillospiraceae bacterium]
MTDWYEKLNNMTEEEHEELWQKTLQDIANMNDEQYGMFLKVLEDVSDSILTMAVWDQIQDEIASRKDEDYELNESQYSKFLILNAYFCKLAKENGGKFEPIPLKPKLGVGYISLKVKVLRLEGEKKTEFFNAIKMFSSFGIDAMTDGTLCIEGVVPEVFVRKDVVNLQ